MRGLFYLAALALAAATAAPAAPPKPLFASDQPIRITIQGPISTLVSKRAPTPVPATLVADGVTYPITLAPRGITRLQKDTCQFPPLRVEFTRPPPAGSLFQGQHRLKLVTHCKNGVDFQQKVLLEYSAYRIYNLLTQQSFRARLANVDYVDADGKPFISASASSSRISTTSRSATACASRTWDLESRWSKLTRRQADVSRFSNI